MIDIESLLLKHLTKPGRRQPLPEQNFLRYSSDLSPDACLRSIHYRLTGTPRDPETLGEMLRYEGGHIFEGILRDALREIDGGIFEQVLVRPLRPSAWAFATGHADTVLVKDRVLIEVKAPRGNAFHYASKNKWGLVREGYRWQAAAYLHELRARNVVDTGRWIFLDREGSNRPVTVEMDDKIIPPLEEIIHEEDRKASIFWPDARVEGARGLPPTLTKTQPPRLPREIVAAVSKANGHAVKATADLSWRCSYCAFAGTCKPGPEVLPRNLTPEQVADARSQARAKWANGEQRVVLTLGTIPNDNVASFFGGGQEVTPAMGEHTGDDHK